MKGFVPTPLEVVDSMVAKLFHGRPPTKNDVVLDPGCGTGVFVEGILRWCRKNNQDIPRIVGIELDPSRFAEASKKLKGNRQVTLYNRDFLEASSDRFDFIVGNPPYVSIEALSTEERTRYRRHYTSAQGRFDLYLLFFEQSLRLLKDQGRLVLITPEKFLYVQTAAPLRRQLSTFSVEEIELVDESTFGTLVTYPTITSVLNTPAAEKTTVRLRGGATRKVGLPKDGSSWLPHLNTDIRRTIGPTLNDAAARVSCGVATGADSVYVVDAATLPAPLRKFAYPTISGRQILVDSPLRTKHVMLLPYNNIGKLLDESSLGSLGEYLKEPARYKRLKQRTCTKRKPWYAFHETPPLRDILQPKILCKDIGARPWFTIDEDGLIVPRHSVYYVIPADPSQLYALCDYLNSDEASDWLMKHCQRAANGFVRLQSHVLKQLPIPDRFVLQTQLASA